MAEEVAIEESLTVSWWNSKSLIYRGEIDVESRRRQIDLVAEIVFYLLQKGTDILALGEIDAPAMQALTFALQQNGFHEFATLCCDDLTTGSGSRGIFDIGIIYRISKISSVQHENIVSYYAGAKIKVAMKLDCTVGESSDDFCFLISHWPSRLMENAKEKRIEAATRLKIFAETVRNESETLYPYILMLGDYNDEPFDKSLSKRLQASRDRGLAAKSKDFFYNPYWRHLGEESPCSPKNIRDSDPVMGTYFYPHAGQIARWFTFDQILFSSAFLGNSDWTIDETKTAVERPDMLKRLIKEKVFDHFPVTGTVLKLTKGQES